jgi:hypothetical protein
MKKVRIADLENRKSKSGKRKTRSENKLCDLGVSAVKSRLTEPFYRRGAEGGLWKEAGL